MRDPKYRVGTKEAMEELASELNLPIESWMQDWPYEIADPMDIERYISHYKKLIDDDKKFVLMEIMLQATNDQSQEAFFLKYWEEIQPLLQKDFKIHEYTIFYWSCFEKLDESEF